MTAAPWTTTELSRSAAGHATVTTRDGITLAIRDHGPRTAPNTVMFLHGLCLKKETWARHDADLRHRYGISVRTISVDHRGHGASAAAPTTTYRVDQLGTDIADVITALDVTGNVVLAGHSMGAMAAIAYASAPAAHQPIAPGGLVLAATAAGGLTDHGLGHLLATPGLDTLCAIIEHAPAHVVNAVAGPIAALLRCYAGHDHPYHATAGSLAASAIATTPLRTAAGFLRSLKYYDQRQRLSRIDARTVVLSGGADPLTPVALARELAAGIAGSTHRHIPTAGHMLLQEAPDAVQAALIDAIGTPPPRRHPGSRPTVAVIDDQSPWAADESLPWMESHR